MNAVSPQASPVPRPSAVPAVVLVFLSPLVGEVLSGATRLSYLFVFIPEVLVWGCGALLIREVVRRWSAGWAAMLLLGLALSVAEEFIIQQTSIAPLPWRAVGETYGRFGGVNWIYFLFMLGYESVWIVLVPVQLTELIFPARRDRPWLRPLGLVVAGALFLVGSFIAWFAWTQHARSMVFHAPSYQPPARLIIAGLAAILGFVALAWKLPRNPSASGTSRSAPPVWLVAVSALLFGFPWYGLMALIFSFKAAWPFWIAVALGCGWAVLSFGVIRRWSRAPEWSDRHKWALVFGAVLVCLLAGYSGSSVWPRGDLIAKTVLDVLAVGAGLLLMRKSSQW